ncbi:MAG: Asp-tRNA(Asn)/Glu-tRNA(Gln) amidotransferase subunit GatC [Chlamydiota bacterium]
MSFDQKTLDHLKKLCRIETSPEEDLDILNSLSSIIEYIAQLDELNCDQAKPCRYVLRGMLKNQMRDDVVKDLLPREQFLANAPDQIGGMIRTPPVMKAP